MAMTRTMQAGERRLLYGANVILAGVLATVVLVFAVILGDQFATQADLTRSGVNSLSPRTQRLLADLEQPVTITAVYPVIEEVPHHEPRQKAVADLLELYENAAAGQVTTAVLDPFETPLQVQQLTERLRTKPAFAEAAAPYQEVIVDFTDFQTAVAQQLAGDVEALTDLARTNAALNQNQQFISVVLSLRSQREQANAVGERVVGYLDEALPRYQSAKTEMESFLTNTQTLLATVRQWLLNRGAERAPVAEPLEQQFEAQGERYQALLDTARSLSRALEGLEPIRFEEMMRQLNNAVDQPPIVIETAREVRVVPYGEVFEPRRDPNAPEGDGVVPGREFLGEQAISSAILQLTQEEQTGIVFVRYGGQPLLTPDFANVNPMQGRLPSAPYEGLNEQLARQNFITAEWNVRDSSEPPALPEAARVVYVVLPPTPPQRPNPMQPATEPGITPPDVAAVEEAVTASGMAMFLVGWQPPPSPMVPTPGTYAYDDYLRAQWGIAVAFNQVAMRFIASPEDDALWLPANMVQRGADPLLLPAPDVVTLTDSPLTAPLRTLNGAFPAVAPLTQVAEPPADVSLETLARVPATERVWAIADIMRLQSDLRDNRGTQRYPEDTSTPFDVALAATHPERGRLIVVGSDAFAEDTYTQAMGATFQGGGLVAVQFYPLNSEFFINSVHWLTGDAARIAVGPRRGAVPTLDALELEDEPAITAFVVGIWPATALVVGAVVWLFRRR
jgi:hypothetical protein